ncbi:MAG: EAL domain-containing protein [Geitlerinemataceae cyanobacterium]
MVQYRQQLHSPTSESSDSYCCDRAITLLPELEIHPRMSSMTGSPPGGREQQRLLVQTKLLRCFARAIRLAQSRHRNLPRSTTPQIWDTLLSQVCEAAEWEYAEVWLPIAHSAEIECSFIGYLGNDRLHNFWQWRQGLTFEPAVGLPGKVWQSQQPEWERMKTRTISTRYGLRSSLAVPMTANNISVGVLVFFLGSDRQPEAEIVELLEAIASQFAVLEQNWHAQAESLRRQQAEIDRRYRDRLLWGVAKAANHLLANPDCQTAVDLALKTLGKAAGVDRVYICDRQIQVDNSLSSIVQFEWVKNADTTLKRSRSPSESFVRESTCGRQWDAALEVGNPVPVVAGELSESERSILEGMTSLLMLPIHVDRECWGYLAFGDYHQIRKWSRREISILQEIAVSFGSAFKRYQVETTIRHQAFHDSLTNLPNRTLFDMRLSWAITEAGIGNHQLAVMFLDLDRFKWINDTLGHPVGDRLLQQMVQRLQSCLRDGDTIARWGGDEFVLLLPHIHGVEDATQIAQRILGAVQPAFAIDHHQLHVSCSIGIAVYPQDGEDAPTLTKNADVALYQVKEQGRNNYQLYQPVMSAQAAETLVLRNSLPYAIARQELSINYLPQFNTETGQITGMEALTYWQHPELGLVSPQTFIPLAEEMGLIHSIGRWVLQTACAQHKIWQDRGFPPICIAVNLSERQFRQPDLLETILEILEETQLDPQFLELEITEATALKNIELTRANLEKWHQIGIRITMDDFGIGYASLSSLKKLPFNKVKIDRSFMRELTIDSSNTAMIDAVLALGRGLNLSVVAEGVETEEHRELLRGLSCQDIQGYLMSLPLNAEDATQLLESVSVRGYRLS